MPLTFIRIVLSLSIFLSILILDYTLKVHPFAVLPQAQFSGFFFSLNDILVLN